VVAAWLCSGRAIKITLRVACGDRVTMWEFEVEDGWEGILFPKIRLATTGKGLDFCGTFRCALKRWGIFLLVLRQIGEEKGDVVRIIIILIALIVTVGASTMEHLARCTGYAARTRVVAGNAGSRGDRGGTVAPKSLTEEDL
jgi:hypothetical protein